MLFLSTHYSPVVENREVVPLPACREGAGLPFAGCLSVEPHPNADTNCEIQYILTQSINKVGLTSASTDQAPPHDLQSGCCALG